jgi:DNA-directed RNA polymerase subunit K/omega
MPSLGISADKVCFLIVRARQFQAKVEPVVADPGTNMTDDGFREVLEDLADDPVIQEMRQFIEGLNEEEYTNLLALMWLGRGDYAKEEWNDILAEARTVEDERGPDYVIGTPLLADYLEEALDQLGYSCEDTERGRL